MARAASTSSFRELSSSRDESVDAPRRPPDRRFRRKKERGAEHVHTKKASGVDMHEECGWRVRLRAPRLRFQDSCLFKSREVTSRRESARRLERLEEKQARDGRRSEVGTSGTRAVATLIRVNTRVSQRKACRAPWACPWASGPAPGWRPPPAPADGVRASAAPARRRVRPGSAGSSRAAGSRARLRRPPTVTTDVRDGDGHGP
jgi:hypothetical protein